MKMFFIQFDDDDDNLSSMLSFLEGRGTLHNILGSLYCFVTEQEETTVSLRDSILKIAEDSRLIVFYIPEELSSAWHLSVENSDWLKSVLNGK